jgi:hypothetical protein
VDAALNRVWAATPAVEMLHGDTDRIQSLSKAIGEALAASADWDAIASALNLAPAGRSRPARQLPRELPDLKIHTPAAADVRDAAAGPAKVGMLR